MGKIRLSVFERRAGMRHIANVLTALRIVASPAFFFVEPMTTAFYVLNIGIWLTDILDGFIARLTRSESELGSKLDTAADLVLAAVLFLRLFPMLRPKTVFVLWMAAISLTKLATMTVIHVRYKVFGMIHTWLNKATGALIMLYPLVMGLIDQDTALAVIGSVATLGAAEELIIAATAQEFSADRKSIFRA